MFNRRIIANLISIAAAMYFVIAHVGKNQDSIIFLIFTLPYILSNAAVLMMLILSTFRKPKDVNDSDKMFLISTLGGNLSVIVGLLGIKVIGDIYFPQAALYASLLSVCIIPFYLVAVFTLGKSLTVLPEANKLKTHGVYRVSRHPLYLTYIVWYILQIFISQSLIIVLTSAIQSILQILRARGEEAILEKNFPEYREYCSKVGWFFKIGTKKI